jgi:Zn-dependent M28 family amino/carboxypeptidase
VETLTDHPDAVVIVDMVGDSDLNIFVEKNSDQKLAADIWGIAANLGYGEQFINQPKHRIVDDHLPFIQAEIPAVLIIDFDYPYWHTLEDTSDKVSPDSLKVVGDVLLLWINSIND